MKTAPRIAECGNIRKKITGNNITKWATSVGKKRSTNVRYVIPKTAVSDPEYADNVGSYTNSSSIMAATLCDR
jgi:hypothetical protein